MTLQSQDESKPDELSLLASRVLEVKSKIESCARACGRAPDEVTLIAVSKTHPSVTLRQAMQLGLLDFGENRVQEAEGKIKEIGREQARWHLIGHLQKNKAKRAVQLFDTIQTVDSKELAARLDELCEQEKRPRIDVFVQVNLGGEESKTGLAESELGPLMEQVRQAKHLHLRGLMTIPPFYEDTEMVRPFFRRLRELRDEFQVKDFFAGDKGELSMGMSHDYLVAVEEGATMVRVGTAIFGARGSIN